MSESIERYKKKMEGTRQLKTVVKSMKAMAAASLAQYEIAVDALKDYFQTIELALSVCFRNQNKAVSLNHKIKSKAVNIIIFGSDQGLVGQFNDLLVEYLNIELAFLAGKKIIIRTIGERLSARLTDEGITSEKIYNTPNSVSAITPLVNELLLDVLPNIRSNEESLYIINHRPLQGITYETVKKVLLPLDLVWQKKIKAIQWPSGNLPEIIGDPETTFINLINEYLFISLFQSGAESLASENASRLAAMQRAENNIKEVLEELLLLYNQSRQNKIDEELFDVVSGFEAFRKKKKKK